MVRSTTWRGGVLALTTGLALACGGGGAPSVDPIGHLQPVCELSRHATSARLPELGGQAVGAGLGQVHLTLTRDGAWLDGEPIDAVDAAVLDQARVRLTLLGQPPSQHLAVYADTDLPASRVFDVLQAAKAGGFQQAVGVYLTDAPITLPPYPDPDAAEGLRAQLEGADPAQRASLAAAHVAGQLSACPSAMTAFEAVAAADPSQRCELLSHGLAEALPGCLLTDGDAVVSSVQVMFEPSTARHTGEVLVQLDQPFRPPEAGQDWAGYLKALGD